MPIPSLLLAAALVSTGLPPVHVALAFGSEPTLPPAVAAAAVHEAADIWSRYRVVVDRTMPCASAPDEAIVLTVRAGRRSEEHTSELQSRLHLVCRLLLEKKKNKTRHQPINTITKPIYAK